MHCRRQRLRHPPARVPRRGRARQAVLYATPAAPPYRETDSTGTSKHAPTPTSTQTLLGRQGTFLASLSAVSLLSITSRHHQYRSHNSLTFHHGKAIERQLPADAHHDIHSPHGTRVTVRNLFGNLPVRVKQRSRVVEHKAENGRLWAQVKANVTALLLCWPGTVSLRARDAENRAVFAFTTSDPRQKTQSTGANMRSGRLASMLNILTQADYISVHQWSSWVPASASTASLAIKGAISTEPIASRGVQFISLGGRPLSADSNYNELYDQVNRLFSLSNFGSVEDAPGLDYEALRQKADKQYARKGVDRCPMFCLQISFREGLFLDFSGDQFSDDKSNVESIVEVLSAMVTQWLSAHHFRSHRLRQKNKDDGASSVPRVGSNRGERVASSSQDLPRHFTSSGLSNQARSNTIATVTQAGKRPSTARSGRSSERLENRAFANWSRIKSGKSDFFSNFSALQKPRSADAATASLGGHNDEPVSPFSQPSTHPLAQGALSVSAPKEDGPGDETILWVDPVTKQTHVLNARTGCMVPLARSKPDTVTSATTLDLPRAHSRLSLRPTLKTSNVEKTAWLDGILETWDNPVFKSSEQCIEQVLSHESDSNVPHRLSQHQCSHFGGDTPSNTPSISTSRLSKESLAGAEVVAQVDKKFILIKTPNAHTATTTENVPKSLLVLVDQHAADERIKVETLFQELCSPMSPSCSSYQSKLGYTAKVASTILEKPIKFAISQHEQTHFTTHAERFAFWGVLFDITETIDIPERTGVTRETHCLLSVASLPTTIAERCRMDIELLISFLRSTVWKYVSDSTLPSHSREPKSSDWVTRLATCPDGLIDMINSRACRSAIMFNDELELNQCEELIKKLAGCVFPFMCAHGRPSLVPLVEVGKIGQAGHEVKFNVETNIGNYARNWQQWKREKSSS
jgi:DNA mismatch repair protein MLH3